MIAPEAASRFMQRYAKQFAAGAFAMPTTKDLLEAWIVEWPGTVAVCRETRAVSRRRDWTGTVYEVPAGIKMLTHLAREPDAPIPDLSAYDWVVAYQEDAALVAGLIEQGRNVYATSITASSSILTTWALDGSSLPASPADGPTCLDFTGGRETAVERAQAQREIEALDGWDDDYPYYSDGSWSALSLRGFYPDDATKGVKPSEMGRKWNAEHPGDLARTCEWTWLAERCPTLVDLVARSFGQHRLERVRILRMDGRDGRGGALGRHTDITDKMSGTRDDHVARFHLPIVTDPRITMRCWEIDGTHADHHLAPWRWWYLDARKPHAVTNPTGVTRVHLVADVLADAQLRTRLLVSQEEALCLTG